MWCRLLNEANIRCDDHLRIFYSSSLFFGLHYFSSTEISISGLLLTCSVHLLLRVDWRLLGRPAGWRRAGSVPGLALDLLRQHPHRSCFLFPHLLGADPAAPAQASRRPACQPRLSRISPCPRQVCLLLLGLRLELCELLFLDRFSSRLSCFNGFS